MQRRHLLLALGRAAYGELTLGLRLAWELHARGDQVLFLTPASLAARLEGTPFRGPPIDPFYRRVDELLPAIAEDERCDDVVLVDLTSHLVACRLYGLGTTFPARLEVPLFAIDIWDLDATTRSWDTGDGALELPPSPIDAARRLRPVPFVRPDAAGAYDALPAPPAHAPDRAAARAALGLADEQRLVLLTTASWQRRPRFHSAYHERLVDRVPELLLAHLARLPAEARVVHVGPAPFACAGILGDRLVHHPLLPAAEFERLLAASDLLLNLNQAATSVGTALAAGLPVATVVSSFHGTAEEIAAALPSPPSPSLRAWLERAAPLHPWRVWPLGLHAFLAPVLEANPYRDVVPELELLDEEGTPRRLRDELFDEETRARRRELLGAYRERLAALPRAADLMAT